MEKITIDFYGFEAQVLYSVEQYDDHIDHGPGGTWVDIHNVEWTEHVPDIDHDTERISQFVYDNYIA